MEIFIKDIPTEGLDLHFDSKSDIWFRDVLTESLSEMRQKEDHGRADFRLVRTGGNVDCAGNLACDCHPTCSRCLKVFSQPIDIPLHLTLAPLYEEPRQLEMDHKEEVELVKEDLNFCFYDGDSFNLSEMIREQIILELPLQPLCGEACKGLCPHCGHDLNCGSCHCRPEQTDARWAPLKSLKTKL